VASPLELDELVDNFTLTADELQLFRHKTGPSQLAFGLLFKYLAWPLSEGSLRSAQGRSGSTTG
jgi:hypothetical protein